MERVYSIAIEPHSKLKAIVRLSRGRNLKRIIPAI